MSEYPGREPGRDPDCTRLRYPLPTPQPWSPAPLYAELRAAEPVARVELPTGDQAWLVTRYAENRALLSDERFSRSAAAGPGAPRVRSIPLEAHALTALDPPEHTRLRELVQRAFSQRRVDGLRPAVQDTCDRLLDGLAAEGPPADLVAQLCRPLPIRVIGLLLGVPPEDDAMLRGWGDLYLRVRDHAPEDVARAAGELHGYLATLVSLHRDHPGDDLLSDLVAHRSEDRLSEDELIAFGVTLLMAGYAPMAHQLSGSLVALFQHPDQYRALRDDPGLLATGLDELLRYTPMTASGGTVRIATDDVRLGAVQVCRGEAVLPALVSANRDPAAFPEPERLDLERRINRHIAFGHGVHRCLGARLARLELEVALTSLLRRFPGLEPDVPVEDLPWDLAGMQRGPARLPVRW
jgi:nocardicin N-oxygenase